MASTLSTRMWRVYKESGRPFPDLCDGDDVLDYMLVEALALKANKEDSEAAKEQKIKDWKKETSTLDKFR